MPTLVTSKVAVLGGCLLLGLFLTGCLKDCSIYVNKHHPMNLSPNFVKLGDIVGAPGRSPPTPKAQGLPEQDTCEGECEYKIPDLPDWAGGSKKACTNSACPDCLTADGKLVDALMARKGTCGVFSFDALNTQTQCGGQCSVAIGGMRACADASCGQCVHSDGYLADLMAPIGTCQSSYNLSKLPEQKLCAPIGACDYNFRPCHNDECTNCVKPDGNMATMKDPSGVCWSTGEIPPTTTTTTTAVYECTFKASDECCVDLTLNQNFEDEIDTNGSSCTADDIAEMTGHASCVQIDTDTCTGDEDKALWADCFNMLAQAGKECPGSLILDPTECSGRWFLDYGFSEKCADTIAQTVIHCGYKNCMMPCGTGGDCTGCMDQFCTNKFTQQSGLAACPSSGFKINLFAVQDLHLRDVRSVAFIGVPFTAVIAIGAAMAIWRRSGIRSATAFERTDAKDLHVELGEE